MFRNLSKPVQWALLGGLMVIAYLLLQPMLFPDAPVRTVRKSTPKSSSKKGAQVYEKEDYTARFEPVKSAIKNNFKPIVYKVPNVRAANATINVIPPAFAGGEQNWSYTGSAEVDGVLQALLENKVTGDNVFLKVGDTWKGISVEEITDDTLVLASPETGLEKKFELPTEDPTPTGAGFAPVNPPLRGNIGPLGVTPDGSGSAALPDTTGGTMDGSGNNGGGFTGRGGGRRGGGRRNRGGGGFGGQG